MAGRTTQDTPDDHRVEFDFEVDFSNGGGIQGQGFRLDIPGTDIADADLASFIVSDLRLLMVGEVRILKKRIFRERHKRSTQPDTIPVVDAERNRLIDLTHCIRDGQIGYPGFPAPKIGNYLSHRDTAGRYGDSVSFQIGRIDMVSNSGTSIDSPFHRYEGEDDVSAIPLYSVAALDGVVVRLTGMSGRAVTAQALQPALKTFHGKAVLIETGKALEWQTETYFRDHPFLTADGARFLRDGGARLVGIDSMNIDDTDDPTRPAHSILLASDIPIVENLTGLDDLPLHGFRFTAAPLRIEGMGAFPVRAWAEVA